MLIFEKYLLEVLLQVVLVQSLLAQCGQAVDEERHPRDWSLVFGDVGVSDERKGQRQACQTIGRGRRGRIVNRWTPCDPSSKLSF